MNIHEKLIEDVCDEELKVWLLDDSETEVEKNMGFYKNWQMLYNPSLTILEWQKLRNQRNGKA